MENLEAVKSAILGLDDENSTSSKIAAVNNKVRLSILEILRNFYNCGHSENNVFKKNPLYSREINSILLNNYGINITPQMLGQHIKQLIEADLIEEVSIKKEVPNKIGRRKVKGYVLKNDAFDNIFLDINFLSDELLSFFGLYKINQKFNDGEHCVLTIFNGMDKGKTFKIHKNETILVGRKGDFKECDLASFTILLDNSYRSVSNVSKPHLKLFFNHDSWCIVDNNSSNGTFLNDKLVKKGIVTKLEKNSFLKLSKGDGGAVIYCSY
ncbi:FHA domain-containing protein [Methanobrevibacter millerae]|jgi:DNA-binding transcriptional ArsR family regulator|uniref:FHA domain-containing protein n=1 Tax=Methanobrevibacter millerae TaxID=230361 RepID=A0A0U3E6E5_9EURY|nr:FHA domain-containing protein [Methanobrevibacter millerae]ALT68496.1 FHA domain-containing protein [Methanobrevibacter millerae]